MMTQDGTWTIIVNAASEADGLSTELREFLDFVHTGNAADDSDSLAGKLSAAVEWARQNAEWRDSYMTIQQEIDREVKLVQEKEHEKTEAERARADAAEERADAEKERADAEKARADAAEREVARLKSLYGEQS